MPVKKRDALKKEKIYFKRKKFFKEKIANNVHVLDKKVLKNALDHLRRRNLFGDNCKSEDFTEKRADNQIKLRCRQLPQVVQELRKTILRQEWNETATLLAILSHPGIKLYSSIIMKICFLLLFCHPKSNIGIIQDFIRSATGYVIDEDIHKFIKILFILRKSAVKTGKYSSIKVTRDPQFDDIR